MFLLCSQKTWAPQLQNSSFCLQKAQALATKFHFLLQANEERRGWICNLPGAVSHLHIHLGFAQQHQAWDAFQNVPPKLGFLPGTSSAATIGLHPPSPLLLLRFLLLYVSSLPESCLPAASFSSSLCFLPAWIFFTCCCKIAPQACCHPLEGNKSNFLKVRPATSEFENLSHLFIEMDKKKRGRTTKKKKQIASGNKGQAKFVVLRNLRVWERKCKGWKKGGLWQKTRLAHCAACHGKSKDSNPSIDESVVITNVLQFYTISGKLCIIRQRRRRSRVQHDFVNVSSKIFHCFKTWLSRAIANLPHSSQDPRNFAPSKEDSEKKFASEEEEEDWENCIPCHNHSPKVPFFHKCPQEIHLIICIYLHRPICFVCVQGNLQ